MPRSIKKNFFRNSSAARAAACRRDCRGDRAPTIASALAEVDSSWKECARNAGTKYVSSEGLSLLVEAGASAFTEATGKDPWPDNFSRGAGRVEFILQKGEDVGRGGRRLLAERAQAQIAHCARMGGWVKAAAGFPAVRKVLEKGLSKRGMNSPRTRISVSEIVKKFPSPGNFERRLWATKKKAEAVLTAYEGQKPSWVHIAWSLMADARPNKAAIIATALTLGWKGGEETRSDRETGRTEYLGLASRARGYGRCPAAYRQARAWLIERRFAAFSTTTVVVDEKIYQLRAMPELVREGVEVFRALAQEKYGQRKLTYIILCGDCVWSNDSPDAESALQWGAPRDSEFDSSESRMKLSEAFWRLLKETHEKADALLEGWRNRPAISWTVCVRHLFLGGLKSALIAAEEAAMTSIGARIYEGAPKLEKFSDRSYPVVDDSDGVRSYLAPVPEMSKLGVTVTRSLIIRENGSRHIQWLVRRDWRTYHVEWGSAKNAMLAAMQAWQRQDELRLVHGDAVAFLEGHVTGSCPLLVRANSFDAGNCSEGTEQWLRHRGWAARGFIPGVWLIPHLGERNVKNVVVQLMRQSAYRRAA